MRAIKPFVGLLTAAALLPIFAVPQTASASGDTQRVHGCAAHWRVTATWNECQNSSNVTVQLQVDCTWESGNPDYYSPWVTVNGSKDPVSRHECINRAAKAWNGFRL